jgi:hypothetical protein
MNRAKRTLGVISEEVGKSWVWRLTDAHSESLTILIITFVRVRPKRS